MSMAKSQLHPKLDMNDIAGIKIPDSKMAQDLTQLVRDTESDLLFHHSTRVYLFGALAGERKGLKYDPELLYAGAMFHDIGLTGGYRRSQLRFEVDGANAARDFLRSYGIPEASVEIVWDAIALHTTPGIPEHKKPEVALVTSGVEMDVLGIAYEQFTDAQREAVVATHPRGDASSAPTSAASYSTPPGHVNESSSYFGQRIIFEGLPSGRYMSAPHTYATDRLSLVLSGTWWVNSGADFDPDNTVPVPAGDSSGGSRGPPTMTGLRRTRTCRPSLLSSESHRFNSN